jgi:hypothetical protein
VPLVGRRRGAARHRRRPELVPALRLAREYQPVYPWSPKSRKVLRIAGGYLVLVRGKSDTYRFRVSLGEEIR